MSRVAIVTRVSTEEQTPPEYNSCQSQQDICRHYVEIQREKGWEVYRVYENAGYSGRNLKRPGIQALLRDVQRDLLDIVLCTRIDRVSRSIRDFYEFWTVLEKHHQRPRVRLESQDGQWAIWPAKRSGRQTVLIRTDTPDNYEPALQRLCALRR